MPAPRHAAGLVVRSGLPGPGFGDVAGPFLARREAEHSFLLGLVSRLRETQDVSSLTWRLMVVSDGGMVVMAAAWLPPFPLVVSMAENERAAAALARFLVDEDGVPGSVTGPVGTIQPMLDVWRALGWNAHQLMALRVYRLDRLEGAAPMTPGTPGPASSLDARLLGAWIEAFRAEALPHEPAGEPGVAIVDRWLRRDPPVLFAWTVHGRPVSMAVAASPTPRGMRISGVYTPPEWRGRGFASALVRWLSERLLESGREFCFLDADVANAASTGIYTRMGYRPVCDVETWSVVGGDGPGAGSPRRRLPPERHEAGDDTRSRPRGGPPGPPRV